MSILSNSFIQYIIDFLKPKIEAKQDKLSSGTNIKTINGESILGEGNISIEGGGDFDSSGTYPNLTAGKATKLATARTISLSGGANGSVSFDGSKDVDIPVTSINEGKVVWNDTYEKNKVSIFDTLFRDSFGNKLAYLNPDAIKVEYSRDGGATWLDYGNAIDGISESINKTRLVTFQCGLGSYYQGKRLQNDEETYTDKLRITIDAIDGDVYFNIKKILIYTSGFVDADNKQVKIETQNYSSSSVDTGLWTTRGIYHIVGQPGWSAIPTTGWPNFGYATSGHIRKVRFTFYQNASSVYRGHVDNIAFLAERVAIGGNTITKTGHLYTMDESQNATFPAKVTATKHVTQGGTSNQVVLGDGNLKALSEIGGSGEDSRYSQFIDILTQHDGQSSPRAFIPIEWTFTNASWNDSLEDKSVFMYLDSGLYYDTDENKWKTSNGGDGVIPVSLKFPYATQDTAGIMSAADKTSLDNLINDDYIYPTNYLANWSGNSTIEVDSYLRIELDNIISYNSNTEGLIFTVNIQTPTQHDGGDYIYLSLCDSNGDELAYIEHLITDEDCHNGTLQLELKCPLVIITSGCYIDLYNTTNEPINIDNPILKRYEVKNVRDISDKLLVKLGDINTILESIINS